MGSDLFWQRADSAVDSGSSKIVYHIMQI